ncbi:MAG: hypothetical protein A2287_00930 [Candidatus Melainabacteria bacterium RIFOXYA12_FULL_32_12]|nr:MAG: hypothetical protein A2255_10305 [Candidatus Melainabacteria bacterium RIFOXYA2_FULL_32_9]OGI29738.1 MAG: hypothetical protein A2287_00930 [Candidatus Melainabacteria bacterium RIFOXYA12_FULL_32_12]
MIRVYKVCIFLACFFSIIFLQSCAVFFSGSGNSGFGGVGIGVGGTRSSTYVGAGVGTSNLGGGVVINPTSSLGLQVNQEILRTRNVLSIETVQTYVSSIGQVLSRNSGRSDIPFNFVVIKDPNINAFASPGGYIYVTTGMLDFLETESELAAVLSHEMAHIVAKHHIKLALTELGLDVTFDYLGKLLNYDPQTVVPRLAQFVVLQKFSRNEEIQADEIGALILARSGYSPYGMVRLFQSLETVERRGFLSNFTASHPTSEDRVTYIEAYIRQNNLNQPGLIVDRPIFHQITAQTQ